MLLKKETTTTDMTKLSEAIERRIVCPDRGGGRIGPLGGTLKLFQCIITIPPGALEREVDFWQILHNNPTEFPSGRLSVAPVLQIRPSIVFKAPVTIRMTTCCADNVGLDILYSKKGQTSNWELLKEVQVQDGGIVEFQVEHFCRYNPVLQNILDYFWGKKPRLHVFNDIYIKRMTAEVVSVFFTDETVETKFKQQMTENGFEKAFPLTERLTYKFNDSWDVEVTCRRPVGYNISSHHNKIDFNGDLQKSKFQHSASFNLDHIPGKEEKELQMLYKITESADGVQKTILERTIQEKWPMTTSQGPQQAFVKIEGGQVGAVGVSGTLENRE